MLSHKRYVFDGNIVAIRVRCDVVFAARFLRGTFFFFAVLLFQAKTARRQRNFDLY